MKINIIHDLDTNFFKSLIDVNGDIKIFENNLSNNVWDLVLFYNPIKLKSSLKVKKGGLIFFSGEPHLMQSLPHRYYLQFDKCFTSRKIKLKNHINHPPLTPPLYDFDFKTKKRKNSLNQILNKNHFQKKKMISVIYTNKTYLKGHRKRLELLNFLKSNFNNKIDFFVGDNNLRLKNYAIDEYKFHIAIENSILDDYFTEKLMDSFLGEACPVYSGPKNIYKYFDLEGLIELNIYNHREAKECIEHIIENGDAIYEEKFQKILSNKKKIISHYNIIEFLIDYCNSNEQLKYYEKDIQPPDYFFENSPIELLRKFKNKFL